MPIVPDYNPADDAEKVVQETIEKVRKPHPDLHIETQVVEGPAAPVLVERSQGAPLLVVGSRGHGELAGMLLGSASEHSVAHAHCRSLWCVTEGLVRASGAALPHRSLSGRYDRLLPELTSDMQSARFALGSAPFNSPLPR